MRQRHRCEAENLARAFLARVCRAVRSPTELRSSDPRCRLRHAAVLACLRLSERGSREQKDCIPFFRRSLQALTEIPRHVEACRRAGHLDADSASELLGAREETMQSLSRSLSVLEG